MRNRKNYSHPNFLQRHGLGGLAVLAFVVVGLFDIPPSISWESWHSWNAVFPRAAAEERALEPAADAAFSQFDADASTASQLDWETEPDDDKKKKKKKKEKDEEKSGRVKGARPAPPFNVPDEIPGKRYVYFMAIGDWGTGDQGQRTVAQLMSDKAGRDSLHFVLSLGDNFYNDGVDSVNDPQWQSKFESMYDLPFLKVPFFASLGNHDHKKGGSPDAQVEYSKRNTRWRMPARYYTFSRTIDRSATIQFFALDTEAITERKASSANSDQQVGWLKNELEKSPATWKVVFGHHPIFSNGKHGGDEVMYKYVRPLLEKNQVDFYLCGHDHDRQLLQPVGGVNYVVSGTGAKFRGTAWEDNTIFAATNLGFTWYRVSADEFHVQFINRRGEIEFACTVSKTGQKADVQSTNRDD